MAWVQEFIHRHPELSNADEIWRHKNYIAGKTGKHWVLYSFANFPIHYLENNRWKPIDENLKPQGNKHILKHIPFHVQNGRRFFRDHHWQPTRIGGYDGKSFRPVVRIDRHQVVGNKIIWKNGLFQYETTIHREGVKDDLYLEKVPSIHEKYLAIEFKANVIPATPFAKDSNSKIKKCDLVSVGDLTYLTLSMDWLSRAKYPVDIDPDYDATATCFLSRSNYPNNYSNAHDANPLSCEDNLSSVSVFQSRTGSPGNYFYSWARSAIKFDLTGVTDTALQASSTWAKQAEFTPHQSGYIIGLYQADWSSYDYSGACQFFTCPDGVNVNDIIRDSATFDINVLYEASSLDTYYTRTGMGLAWINLVTGNPAQDYVYYALKTTGDESSTEPTGNEGCGVFVGSSSNYPAYLTLDFETYGHIFGTIVG